MSGLRVSVVDMTEDAAQRAVVDAPVTASGVIIGAPGTGKTHALVDRVVGLLHANVLSADEVLVLTPSRQAATALRDRIGVRVGVATPGPLARSLGSFAFQLVRGSAVRAGQEPPALLTGAEQDRIIAEMLAGDEEDERDGRSRWPAALGSGVRASRDFRSELRTFIAECTELGVGPDELRGSTNEVWSAAAGFIEEYRTVLDGLRSAHRDSADLLAEASAILRSSDSHELGPLSALRVVFIDDAQELTRGGVEIVRALRTRGVAVMAFGDPDISSGAFRGASPELFAQLAAVLGEVFVVDAPHRQSVTLSELTRTVTQAIGAAGRVDHRRPPGRVDADRPADDRVTTFLAPSPHEEHDRIAGVLRDWHLLRGIPWERMAVIAHDTRQVAMLETELAAREVPTRAAGVQRPLGRETVVRDIVGIVRMAMTTDADRDPDALAEALLTPFGGLDAVGLRRLRARLRHRELETGGSRPARELLRDSLAEPAQLLLIDTPEARAADRFGSMLRDVGAAADRGETIHELLWRVWDASRGPDGRRLEVAWRETAETPGGVETARALDALVALFDAAKRSVERSPEDGPEAFIHGILDSEVPEDTLSALERPQTVALLTPATALGTEFEAVVIAGVQEGVWPNVRLRGGLLGTWRLAESIDASRSGRPEHVPQTLDRRRSALHDELRLFVRALSRARTRLLVTAVDDDDQSPSALFGFLPAPVPDEGERMAYPLTLRGLVARHRRTLTSSDDPRTRADAAGQLRLLTEAQVPGASPEEWYGTAGWSTPAPLRDLETAVVSVSPSRLEAFEECGLGWVVSALGGDTVSPPSAGIGTILHAALERVPDGDLDGLRAVLDERWPELDFETAWLGRKERRRAELYVERMHAYVQEVARDGGRVLASEAPFRFTVDLHDAESREEGQIAQTDEAAEQSTAHRAVVSGVIDRVEVYPQHAGEHASARGQRWTPMADGAAGQRVVVVDLKSGKYEPDTEAAVVEHAQLAAYQIAVQHGLIDGAPSDALVGARLLIVSKTVGKSAYRVAHQHVLDEDARASFVQRVIDAGRGMAASNFTAQVQAHCADTQVYVRPCRIHTVEAVSA